MEWKLDIGANNMLNPAATTIEGFKVRPPNYFQMVPKREKIPIYTEWVGGNDPPVWFVKSGEEATADTWEDPGQIRVIQGMCPLYPGSPQMTRCETETVPRQFRISIRTTSFTNSDDNLATLASHEIASMRNSMDTKNLQINAVEFGTINGVRFARQTWSAEVPVLKNLAGTSLREPSPAQGYCYATIVDGKVVQMTGQAPKGDDRYKAIEEAALSFYTAAKTP